ncbi:MAG: hypothetical protein HY784_03580 [Chloroflexi bacterium]|nr:hypothetical protein [Chloroflexota bacterium]
MHAGLIGRMILARWLDYSPDRYERLVEAVTCSAIYRQTSARIEVAQLPAALAESASTSGSPASAVARLIPVERSDDPLPEAAFAIAYRHPAWGKEFRVDGRAPVTGDAADPELDWLLRCLRPINTRNRLTHLILVAAALAQDAFLRSGSWADLQPQNLTAFCRWLAGGGGHMGPPLPSGLETVDVSLVSRATRGFVVHLPAAGEMPLRSLLPNARTVLRFCLKALLDAETLELKCHELERPRTDDELRQLLQAGWGQTASRRTVAAARQSLGIPPWRRRAGRPVYPLPGFDFSPLRPLTPEAVLAHAPAGPGVYEIGLSEGAFTYPIRSGPVIYLGRSRNLRNRLRAHLRNHEKFGREIGDGRFIFRFAAVAPAHLQSAEAELARAFFEVHGALPCYNIVTPSGGRRSG